ncbi:MAG: hypothetical protein K2Q18_04410 [Bdellovibrionales bacterium]|nr:hypothetical protein [Bdellovibrionales bacterium]
MIKVKENLIPNYLFCIGASYTFSILFFFYDDNRNLLFIGGALLTSFINFYIRGSFSKYGLNFSENVISFIDVKEEFHIPWKHLTVEIADKTYFPIKKNKFFFKDKTKFHNAFYYDVNFQNQKSFYYLVKKFAPVDHEIHKLINQ